MNDLDFNLQLVLLKILETRIPFPHMAGPMLTDEGRL